jgi:hypothetical protein
MLAMSRSVVVRWRMALFCFAFIPLLFFWRRAADPQTSRGRIESGTIGGFLFGIAAALVHALVGELVRSRGFGLSAFVSQMVDGVPFQVLPSIGVYALLRCRAKSGRFDVSEASNFALAWLVPFYAAYAVRWSSVPDPVRLVVMPTAAAALALAYAYWIRTFLDEYGLRRFGAGLILFALPFAAAGSAWAFFSCYELAGAALGILTLAAAVPAVPDPRKVFSSSDQ